MKQETEERKRQRFKRQIAGKDSEARDRRKTENQETNRRKRQ